MRPLKRSAALAALLALVLSLLPILPASAVDLPAPPAAVQLNDVQFIDANNGWAVGGFMHTDGKDYAVVMRTTDGGQNWTRATVLGQPVAHYFTDIAMVSTTTGFALDSATQDFIYKTSDGGVTWTPQTVTEDFDLAGNVFESVKFFDANNGVLAGTQKGGDMMGVVWKTSDGGATWQRSGAMGLFVNDPDNPEIPVQVNVLHSIGGYNPQNLVAVGRQLAENMEALAYRYSGGNWITQTVAPTLAQTNLTGVSYADSTHALAVGALGRAMSFNGTSWTAQDTGVPTDLDDVQLIDANNGWVVGDAGVIRKWNGATFTVQTSGTTYRLRAVHFRDANNGWAVGGGPDNLPTPVTREVMLKTTNGGATWSKVGIAPPAANVSRVAGVDRVDTALKSSQAAFPTTASAVVVASGWSWTDALPGSALAGAVGGPLLLVRPTVLDTAVKTEITRLGAKTVYVVGNTTSVNSAVRNGLRTISGVTVIDVGGTDVYSVTEQIAARIKTARGTGGTVYIARSDVFADALAASSLAAKAKAPIILVPKSGTIPAAAQRALRNIAPATVVICGSDLAVDVGVANQLKTITGKTPVRLGGAGRYDTAKLIIEYGTSQFGAPGGIYIATGRNYPDALAGGVLAGAPASGTWRPLMTTEPTYLVPQASIYINEHATVTFARVLGSDYVPATGAGAVDDAVLTALGPLLH